MPFILAQQLELPYGKRLIPQSVTTASCRLCELKSKIYTCQSGWLVGVFRLVRVLLAGRTVLSVLLVARLLLVVVGLAGDVIVHICRHALLCLGLHSVRLSIVDLVRHLTNHHHFD
jgi:hypothetical protein